MLYLYYYRSLGGKLMPDVYHGTEQQLRDLFKDSATPLVRVIPMDTPQARREALLRLSKQRKSARPEETGLLWSINACINEIQLS